MIDQKHTTSCESPYKCQHFICMSFRLVPPIQYMIIKIDMRVESFVNVQQMQYTNPISCDDLPRWVIRNAPKNTRRLRRSPFI